MTLATGALDARDPKHADIIGVESFADGSVAGPIDITGDASPEIPPEGQPGLAAVFVFTLADGTLAATGVACTEAGDCEGVQTPK